MTVNHQLREADHSEIVLHEVYNILGRASVDENNERLQDAAVSARVILGHHRAGLQPADQLHDRVCTIIRWLERT